MAEDRRIIHEITPLMGKDVLYIADRHKKEFTYPIHNHSVFELNFVENAAGVKRIVGDSQEVIGDFDLCLITSPDLDTYGNRTPVAVKTSVRLPSSLISVWVRRLSSAEIRMPALPV